MAFENMSFKDQITSLKRRGTKWSEDLQTALVRAHVQYVQVGDNPDFDAIARVLNAAKAVSLRNAQAAMNYVMAHGPYKIDYRLDKKTKLKRFYCSYDRSETANEFKEMTVQWNDWDNPKAEVSIKGATDFIKLIKSVANDTDSKRWDATTVALAKIALNTVETASTESMAA